MVRTSHWQARRRTLTPEHETRGKHEAQQPAPQPAPRPAPQRTRRIDSIDPPLADGAPESYVSFVPASRGGRPGPVRGGRPESADGGRCRGGAARSRVHHGLEGDGALSPLRRAATSRPCAHGTSFHQSCERAHAPRRSCESVFADSRNFGTPGRRRAMSFCEVVARFAGRRGREKEESWRHARGRVDS